MTSLVPFAEQMESALIVSLLQDPLLLPRITKTLQADDFYKESNKEIFKVMAHLEPENLDSLTVEAKLSQQQDKDYLKGLVQDSDKLVASSSNALYYAEEIKSKSKLRKAIDLGREITGIAYTPNIDATEAEQLIENQFAQFLRSKIEEDDKTTPASFREFIASLANRIKEDEGTQTGYYYLDAVLHNLVGLYVLAANTSVGKTSFAVNIARHVAQRGNVLFFSLEQPRNQIFERLLAMQSKVNLDEIVTGAFVGSPEARRAVEEAEVALGPILEHMHIDDRANVSTEYVASISRQKFLERKDLDLIIVDYLHLMALNPKKNTVESLGDAVKELRALGKELNCPVLLLSQLSRANNNEKTDDKKRRRPILSDLRSSGEIEQSADAVLFLHRESYENHGLANTADIVEVIVAKNRQGRTGIVPLRWSPQFMLFEERQ